MQVGIIIMFLGEKRRIFFLFLIAGEGLGGWRCQLAPEGSTAACQTGLGCRDHMVKRA